MKRREKKWIRRCSEIKEGLVAEVGHSRKSHKRETGEREPRQVQDHRGHVENYQTNALALHGGLMAAPIWPQQATKWEGVSKALEEANLSRLQVVSHARAGRMRSKPRLGVAGYLRKCNWRWTKSGVQTKVASQQRQKVLGVPGHDSVTIFVNYILLLSAVWWVLTVLVVIAMKLGVQGSNSENPLKIIPAEAVISANERERARRKKKAIRVHNCTSRTDVGEEDREAE